MDCSQTELIIFIHLFNVLHIGSGSGPVFGDLLLLGSSSLRGRVPPNEKADEHAQKQADSQSDAGKQQKSRQATRLRATARGRTNMTTGGVDWFEGGTEGHTKEPASIG